MAGLIFLAVVASLSIPILVPQYLASAGPASLWAPLFFLLEILVAAGILKALYPRNSLIRCVAFGLLFLVVRLLLCFVGSCLVDPEARIVWGEQSGGEGFRWGHATIRYMYTAWWVAVAQYASLFLWLPVLLERAMPGLFPPRLSGRPAVVLPDRNPPVLPPSPKPLSRLTTFHELEQELGEIEDLIEWVVFSPERLPVWHSGQESSPLLQAPEVLRRVSDASKPVLRSEWDGALCQSLLQTEQGYCLMTILPGDFLFSSLWNIDPEKPSARAVLQSVLERTEILLQIRFGELK